MAKYPSEIFGFRCSDSSDEATVARREHNCPFHNGLCNKQSRLIDIPFGVCTAHVNGVDLALCPRRFLERDIVFRHIALDHFGSLNNLLVFSEVGLKGIGNFDFVVVKHKPLSVDVEDFVVIEFQTGQTTSTGGLVQAFKDFTNGGENALKKSYPFGINSYDIWKRTFTQILNKGIILEKWKKKIYWAVQDQVFDYFQHKYRLGDLGCSPNHSTYFSLYDLKPDGKSLTLTPTRTLSSTIDDLFDAFRRNDEIPPVDAFIKRLEDKISGEAQMGLRLDIRTS